MASLPPCPNCNADLTKQPNIKVEMDLSGNMTITCPLCGAKLKVTQKEETNKEQKKS